MSDIAIIGLGLRFPGARTVDELWRLLASGASAVGTVPESRWDATAWYSEDRRKPDTTRSVWGGFIDDVDCFDAAFFNISRREAELMDPQQRLALELAWKAVEDAGIRPGALAGSRTGVFMGTCNADYARYLEEHAAHTDAYFATGIGASLVSNRISFVLDLVGPSTTVDTACASSLVALHQAVRAIENGECGMALAGAVNMNWTPRLFVSFSQAGMLSPRGACRAFDQGADGFVRSEGGAVLLLKPLEQALADGDPIHACIKASGFNHGGRTRTLTATNPQAQAQLIADVVGRAGVDPADISYVEAHGPGTPLGDPIEVLGLKMAFAKLYGERSPEPESCGLGSVKGNLGHLESAAGMAGLVKVVLAMRHATLPATVGFEKLNPKIHFEGTPFYIVDHARPWTSAGLRCAGLSAFGFGGSHSHVVLQEVRQPARGSAALHGAVPVPLSARTPERLVALRDGLLQFLEEHKVDLSLADVAHTLQHGREPMAARAVFEARSIDDLVGQLRRGEDDAVVSPQAQAFLAGEEVDWSGFYDGTPRRIELPTYPFARTRYWLDDKSARPLRERGTQPRVDAGDARVDTRNEEPAPTLLVEARVEHPALQAPGVLSTFVPTWAPCPRPSELPGTEGRRVSIGGPMPGADTITLDEGASIASVADRLDGARIGTLYWVSGGVRLLFRTIKAMLALGYGERPLAWRVRTDAAAALSPEVAVRPESAAMHGLLGSMANEHPAWTVSVIDGPELFDAPAGVWACRGARWYREQLLPVEPTEAVPPLRLDGPVLIIGGAGGLGRAFTPLLKAGGATVIWVGRRPADAVNVPHGVEYYRADASDGAELARVGREIRARHGALRGVIEATKTLLTERLADIDEDRCLAGLACPLEAVAEALPLEPDALVIVFSSIASFVKDARQSRYAVACRVKDAWAHELARRGLRVKAIHWGYWASVGAVAQSAGFGAWLERAGMGSIEPAEGMAALSQLVDGPWNRLMLLKTTRPEALEALPVAPDTVALSLPRDAEAPLTITPTPPIEVPALRALEREAAIQLGAALARVETPAPQYEAWLAHCRPLAESDGTARRPRWPRDPRLEPWVELLEPALDALPDVLQGRRPPTEVLFPSGSSHLVEGVYRNDPVAPWFHETVARAVEACAQGRPLRILEVGAGTGATCECVLEKLGPSAIAEYVFTDISPTFVRRAEARFGARITGRVLNLERPPAEQGFARGTFDVVLGSNVVHATRDLREALRGIKWLLRRGGVLVLDELDAVTLLNHLTFGLLPGWWRFQDPWLRLPGAPLVGADTWREVLAEEGMPVVLEQSLEGAGRRVMVGRSDGCLRVPCISETGKPPDASSIAETGRPYDLPIRSTAAPVAKAERSRGTSAFHTHLRHDLRARIAACVKIPPDEIRDDQPFADLGLDSIAGIDLVDQLNRALGLELDTTIIFDHSSVIRLATHLERLVRERGGPQPELRDATATADTAPPPDDAVAVIGMAGQWPGAPDVRALWDVLMRGVDVVGPLPSRIFSERRFLAERARGRTPCRWGGVLDEGDCFDPLFFSISPRDAAAMSVHQRLVLQEGWRCIEDAGYDPRSLAGRAIAVYVGVEPSAFPRDSFVGSSDAIVASRLSYFLDLRGPALSINTGCSSSGVSLHLACEALRRGEVEMALAGGVHATLDEDTLVKLSDIGMLSPTGVCRAFDDESDGTVLSEAVGMVCLKRLSQAMADGDAVYGVIRASGINQDGASNGITAPNGDAQERLLQEVWTRFGIDPATIGYVEAHGTGTPLGDPIEVHALQRALSHFATRPEPCALGSIKTHVGHTAAAAAVSGLVAVLLAMQHRTIPGLRHFQRPNRHLRLEQFALSAEPRPWREPTRTAALNSFGHSGTNAHLVVTEVALPPRPGRLAHPAAPLVFPISASDDDTLCASVRRLLDHLEAVEDAVALAHTLQTGRAALPTRAAFVARDVGGLHQRLTEWLDGRRAVAARPHGDPEEWLASGDSERLAAWWASGGDVEWTRLYRERPRRLHLPGYPFRRDRYALSSAQPEEVAVLPQGTLQVVPEWVNTEVQWRPPANTPMLLVGPVAPDIDGRRVQPVDLASTHVERLLLEATDSPLFGFRVVRALLDGGHGEHALDLTVITRADRPEHAALHGLFGSAAREYPRWTVRVVLLDGDAAVPADTVRLPAGLWRHHGGRWQQRRLSPWTPAPLGESRFRHEGVYVIAGGAGGLGRVLSAYLAQRYAARLVWLGRRPPEEIDAGEALYVQADLADRGALERAYHQIRRRHPRVHGVVHSALSLADQSLSRMDEARFLAAVTPKLDGTRNLVEVFAREPLDFVLLFSAMNAFVTPPGQANYAAGCAAQDALAATLPGRVRVVNWGWWGSHGVVSGPQYRERLASLGLASIEPEEGLAFIERLLAGPDRQVAMLKTSRPVTLDDLASPIAPRQVRELDDGALPRRTSRPVREVLLDLLSHALLLDPARINPEASFVDYGLDSISGVAFIRALNEALGCSLTNTDLFDYCSVDRMSALLEERRGPAVGTDAMAPTADDAVAIVGISGRFTGSPDVHALWANLEAGRDLVGPVTRFPGVRASGALLDDIARFDPMFFNISGAEATFMDPQQRIFLEEAWTALEDAGYAGPAGEGRACGVYLGCHEGDYQRLIGDAPPAQAFWGNSVAVAASRIAYHLDLKGPAIAIDTACSSSLVAIHLACQALRSGEIEMAVAGGVFVHSTDKLFRHAERAGMLSAQGRCATFDASADGFVFGEGAGAVVLKRLSDALADGDHVYGVVRASGINQDGTTNGITAPSARSQEALVTSVYERHGIDPERIAIVEAHGTATRLGDPIEVEALTRAFRRATTRRQFCAIGSIKTSLGHASAAAGVAGLLKLLLAMRHGVLPPSLHFRANPEIDFASSPFFVNTEMRPWPADRPLAAISGFGFSGTNAHLVIEMPPQPPTRTLTEGDHVVLLSARTESQLRALALRLAEHCEREAPDCADVAWTLATGRKHLKQRVAFRARTVHDLAEALRAWATEGRGGIDHPYVRGQAPDIAAIVRGRRIPLPTYPFDHGRYWVTSEHPMLQRRLSPDRFASTFTGTESFIADHILDGERLLPGVAYLEMARAAAGAERVRLTDVVWLRPLAVPAPVEVEIVLKRQPDGEAAFEISSAQGVHAQGRIRADVAPTGPLDIARLRAECDLGTIEPEQIYAPFRQMGFSNGASHQGIERVWQGRGRALASLALPAGSLFLDPGMLDSALLVTAALMRAEGRQAAPLLPFELRDLEIHAPSTERMWVLVTRGADGRFDFDLADADGRVCVRMRGFSSRPLERPETMLLVPREAPIETHGPMPSDRRVLSCGFDLPGAQRLDLDDGSPLEVRFERCAVALLEILQRARPRMLQVVVPDGTAEAALFAGLVGMLRTAQLEYPDLTAQLVVAPPSADLAACARCSHDMVRWRDGRPWGEKWQALEAPAARAPWKDGGAYLITGAGGGLGAIVARDVAARARGSTLVLIGRRLPRIEGVEGARVIARAVDVSRGDEVARLFEDLRREGVRLNGIVHAAGVLRDRLIPGKTRDELRAVLAPKVAGAMHLDRESRAHPLDFFVLFAAGAGAFGNPGQADYAAANAFLDVFAERRRGPGRSLAVDWPLWRDGGMTVDASTRDRLRRESGMVPMASEAGLDALYRGLAAGVPRMFVIAGDRARIERRFLQSREAPRMAGTARRGDFLDALRSHVARLLQIPADQIDPDDDLLALGFDSISLTSLSNSLNEAYGLRLTPTLFFEHATLARLAAYLGDRLAPATPAAPVADAPAPALYARAEIVAAPLHAIDRPVPPDAVAIIGMSGCFPGAENLDQFWSNLVAGKDSIREIPPDRWDWRDHPDLPRWGGFIEGAETFDPLFFGLSGREAEGMDPAHRLLLMHAWRALEDAGHAPRSLAGTRTGVFVGMGPTGWDDRLADAPIEGHSAIGTLATMGPNRLSWFLDLRGPSQPIETACSSSLVAVHRAVAALRDGSCDAAIVGGVNLMLSPRLHVGTAKSGMLAPDGRCKAFAETADGYVRGEGVGVLVLKPLRQAEAEGDTIYAVIRGSAENHGGRAATLTSPNPQAQAALLEEAYRRAGIDPATVGYVEAHGTGTKLGDPIEVEALKRVFPAGGRCGLGTVKSNIGHLEVAAGVAGLLKAVLSLRHRMQVKTLHCEGLNPHIDLAGSPFEVRTETVAWDAPHGHPRRAGVSSFGAGGSNAHVIVEEYPAAASTRAEGPALIVLSARTSAQLDQQVERLVAALSSGRFRDDDLSDIAYTLQVGRDAMQHRVAVIAETVADAIAKLSSGSAQRGQAARDNPFLRAFAEDDALLAAVSSWLERGDLKRVLELWVQGLSVDWRPLHRGRRPRRLSLPTYPFAADCYSAPRVAAIKADRLHPLVHRNASTIDGVEFEATFTGSEPFLADHCVEGRPVLPGAAWLEMAAAAVRLAAPRLEGVVALRDVYFVRPLAVKGTSVRVQIRVGRDLEFDMREPGGESYCRGRATLGAATLAPLRSPELRDSTRMGGGEAYALMAEKGLQYGPAHRGLTDLVMGHGADGERWVRARLSYDGPDVAQFGLHPGLLDAALQATLGLAPDEQILRLPFSVGEVEILGATSSAMEVVAVGREGGRVDLDLLDANGVACVRLRGFTSRPLAASSPAVHSDEVPAVMLTPVWDRVTAPTTDGASRLVVAEPDVMSLFRRVKALIETHRSQPLRLVVVTSGGAGVHPDEVPDPVQASMQGLACGLAQEYPDWDVQVVDLDPADPACEAALPEMESGTVWAVRDGVLYRRRLARLQAPAAPASAYRDGGTWLVIGGAGGLGAVWTREVLARHRAQVVWIGRRPLDAHIQARMQGLEPRPAYYAADARDPDALAAVVADVTRAHGPIRGVVLSALELRDMPLARMEETDFRAAWSTKADIAASAMRVFAGQPLDFVLFFSSLMAYDAHRGQANYAAGCAYETALARAWNLRVSAPVRVVHWGYWGGAGIVAGLRDRMARQGVGSIEAPEAMAALDVLLGGPLTELALVRDRRWVDVPGDAVALLGDPLPHVDDDLVRAAAQALEVPVEAVDLDLHLADAGFDPPRFARFARALGCPLHASILNECERLGDLAERRGPPPPAVDADEAEMESCLLALLAERLPESVTPAHERWLAEARRRVGDARPRPAHNGHGAAARWAARREAWLQVPHLRGRVALVEATLGAMTEIVAGTRAAQDVMFPAGALDLVRAVYQDHPVSDYFNEALAGEVERYVQGRVRLDPRARLRILEVGAGTGATTAAVLRRLRGHETAIEVYCFTDLSRVFLNEAQRRFTDPGMQFALVDVEAPVEGGPYDVVIAANVLHATRDVTRTLVHLKRAMRRGGMLFVNEISTHSTFGLLTFGLLDGWWRFDDVALRMPGGPGLTPDGWRRALERGGFGAVRFPARPAHDLGQQIVVAESDGVVVVPATPRREVRPTAPVAPRTTDGSVRGSALRWLGGRVAEILKVPAASLDPQEPLESYGLDSIMVVQLTQAFRRDLDVEAATFFEHATLGRLVDHLLANQPERMLPLLSLDDEPAPTVLPRTEQAAPRTLSSTSHAVAIVGISARFAQADTLDAFWHNLASGASSVREVPAERWDWRAHADRSYTRWGAFMDDIDKFDPLFFRIAPAEAEKMDPQQRVFLEAAYACVQDAGYTPAALEAGGPVGVFVGLMNGDYPGASFSSVANRVSFHLDFHGPSLAVDTACSSSLSALHLACESLAGGACATAVAGGVNLIVDPIHYARLADLTMLSAGECNRAFGDGADGFVVGEGVAAVLLKPLDRALADGDHVYGVILGSALNAGGRTSGYTVPSAGAQAAVVRAALTRAGVEARTITCVEAHGTGTILGDPIEVAGLKRAFAHDERAFCALGSVKSNIGHCEGAAGMAGLVKVLLQMQHGQLAPTLHAEVLNPSIDFDESPFVVQRRLAPWPRPVLDLDGERRACPRRAGLSSFGAGGANAHVIVEEAPPVIAAPSSGKVQAIVLSARDEAALRASAVRLAHALHDVRLEDLAFTLQVGREAMPRRLAFRATTVDEVRVRLERFASGDESGVLRGHPHEPTDDALVAWARGGEIDWTAFHDGPRRRVPLPAYPFARESYWLVPARDERSLEGENTSDFAEQRFTWKFSGEEPFLRDHRVAGRRVLPAAVILEMVRSAAARSAGIEPTILRNVVWAAAVEPGTAVHLGLLPDDDDTASFELYSEADGERTLHAQGQVGFDDLPLAPRVEFTVEGERIDVAECYAELAAAGFEYGPTHRVLAAVIRGDDQVVADLVKHDGAVGGGLCPSLLDGALQAAHWLSRAEAGPPFAVAEVRLFAPLPTRVRVLARRGRGGAADIDLCDDEGRVAVRVVGLSGRPRRGAEQARPVEAWLKGDRR